MADAETKPRTVAVLGATGNVGAPTVERLRRLTWDVRPISRRQEAVEGWRRQGIDGRRADLDEPATVQAALQGADTLLLIVAATPAQAEHGAAAVRAAEAAGVRRIVHVGSADGRIGSPVPWADACARTDQLIRRSQMTWTLLHPTAFDEDLLELAAPIGFGWLPQVAGDGAVGWIDSDDISRVAVEVIGNEVAGEPGAYDGQTLTLTGPALLSFAEVAEVMTERLGRPVRHVDVPVPVFAALMRLGGADRWTRDAVIAQFAEVVRHGRDGSDVLTGTVAQVTGQAPVPFGDWVEAHGRDFAGPGAVRALRDLVRKTRRS